MHIHLGLTFQSNMSWNNHILSVYEKASQRLNMLKPLKFKIDKSTLACLYKSFIRPIMEYGDIIWDNCTAGNSELLESVQYQSARVVILGPLKVLVRIVFVKNVNWPGRS